jgi:hypothetical protein
MQSSDALKQLEAKGFSLPIKPKYDIPKLPRDITDLDDEALMELFVMLTSWSNHIGGQLAIAAVDEREADRSVSILESQTLLSNWKGGSGDRVTIVKAQIAADPRVIKMKEDLDAKHAYRKLVETLAQNVDKDCALVSRELTRRTSDASGFRSRARRVI